MGDIIHATSEEYLVSRKEIEENQVKIKALKNFQYAHFVVPLYKFPFVPIITIYLPLWYISIISLGNFFIGTIIVIAGRMVAFAALLPTIRGQLATSPTITFT